MNQPAGVNWKSQVSLALPTDNTSWKTVIIEHVNKFTHALSHVDR